MKNSKLGYVAANSRVLMANGSVKPIEEIIVGDFIMTPEQINKPVLEIHSEIYTGKLFHIKSKNNKDIICDRNYLFHKVNMEGLSDHRVGLSAVNDPEVKKTYTLNYINNTSELINKGDLLLSAVIDKSIKNNLTPNRARLLGIYAAEGSFAKKYGKRQSVRFTLGIKEDKFAENIRDLCLEEFSECSIQINPEPHRSIIEITLSGFNIAEYFYYHCGEYSHLKKLSEELCFSNEEIKRHFLSGYIDGDGCISDNKIIIITTSDNLAFQVRNMFNSLKVSNCIRKVYTGKNKIVINKKYKEYNCRDNFRIELTGRSYEKIKLKELAIIKTQFTDKNIREADNFKENYCLHFVRSADQIDYSGKICSIITGNNDFQIVDGIISTSYWSE